MTLLDPRLSPARDTARRILKPGERLRWIGVAPVRAAVAYLVVAVVATAMLAAVLAYMGRPLIGILYDVMFGANVTGTPPWAAALLAFILAIGALGFGAGLFGTLKKIRAAGSGAARALMITDRRIAAFDVTDDPRGPLRIEEAPLDALEGASAAASPFGGAYLKVKGRWPDTEADIASVKWFPIAAGAEQARELLNASSGTRDAVRNERD